MITVMFYFKKGDHGCEEVERDLIDLQNKIPFELVKINIDADNSFSEAYQSSVPVVQVGPYLIKKIISKMDIEIALNSAIDREEHLSKVEDVSHQKRLDRGHRFSIFDTFLLWASRHYMAVINTGLALFIGIAFVPAVLMKAGYFEPAKVIYSIYSPLCHQLDFRSWFLFGEQGYYPRELAQLSGVKSIEEILNISSEIEKTDQFIVSSRNFIGEERIGYKTALCQRDIAIYGGLLLFGILFSINQRRNKPIRWIVWLLIGVLPIALDGFSQFPTLINGLPDWLPSRESTPILRTITGVLFGLTTAWYLFPIMEESMKETRVILISKKAITQQTALRKGG